MKKAEAEREIRQLCHTWRKETGRQDVDEGDLIFSEFWSWMKDYHYQCTEFKATAGAEEMAEIWFDQEFKQMWTR
ncbi:hypothetical protein PUR23_07230 [Methylorubrum populi]|jgi:hypothetical protein|uniref:hypothetical protein n=1 Tax=Methylorubrum populi TaxID=223967 RepID=UPI000A40BC4F